LVSAAGCGEVSELRDALAALVTKLDEIGADPDYKAVWALAHVHGFQYRGPNYAEALERARAVLANDGAAAKATGSAP
jgi:hypothetical protein